MYQEPEPLNPSMRPHAVPDNCNLTLRVSKVACALESSWGNRKKGKLLELLLEEAGEKHTKAKFWQFKLLTAALLTLHVGPYERVLSKQEPWRNSVLKETMNEKEQTQTLLKGKLAF